MHYNLGKTYILQNEGRPDEKSVRELETTLRLDPNNAGAHCLLGVGYARQGRRGAAIREAKLAMKLNQGQASQEAGEWIAKWIDRAIDELLALFQQGVANRESFQGFYEYVDRNIDAISADLFNRLEQRIAQGQPNNELSQMCELLLRAQYSSVSEAVKMLVNLANHSRLTEGEVEAYLKQAGARYYFPLYVSAISLSKTVHNQSSGLSSFIFRVNSTNALAGFAFELVGVCEPQLGLRPASLSSGRP